MMYSETRSFKSSSVNLKARLNEHVEYASCDKPTNKLELVSLYIGCCQVVFAVRTACSKLLQPGLSVQADNGEIHQHRLFHSTPLPHPASENFLFGHRHSPEPHKKPEDTVRNNFVTSC